LHATYLFTEVVEILNIQTPMEKILSRKIKYLAFCAFTLSIAGCETPEQTVQRLLPAAAASCQAFGFTPGSNSYASCLQQEVRRLEDREAAALEAFGSAFETATPASTTCYTSGWGYSSTTTCY
jgi:hypothetical protein